MRSRAVQVAISRAVSVASLTTLAVLLVACAPGAGEGEGEGEGETLNCTDRGELYTAGMKKTGEGGLTVTLLDASPSPPDVGLNRWTVNVEDSGQALAGAEVAARAWMPDHSHGPQPAHVASEPADGEYELEAFDLFMSGYWEITLEVGPPSDPTDSVVFSFCAEG